MTDAAQPGRFGPRAMRIALVISLGLNLAVAGLLVGHWLSGPPPSPRGGGGLWRYGAALPEPYRFDLAHALRAGRRDWDGPRRGLRRQSAALAAALVADPYDPDEVARVLTSEREMLGALVERGTALLLEQIGRMSPDERRAYAEALRRPPGPPRRDP